MNDVNDPSTNLPQPDLLTTTKSFAKIGLLSFGGPAAQISLMHRILVDENRWLSEKQYLNALSFCMLLPGPEAMQLATYSGWRLHGVLGGLIGGLLFVVPGALIVLALATVYSVWGSVPVVSALFLGVKACVLVIVLEALLKVSKRALKTSQHWIIAACAFIGIFFLAIPFPFIVFAAAVVGFLQSSQNATPEPFTHQKISWIATLKTILIWLAVWILPLLMVYLFSDQQILTTLAGFFSKLAVVTFGGAYAVLAYMAQDVIGLHGWLTASEMMDGLGLAETTPGPLILVTEFVGFLAAFRAGGFWLGLAGAGITLWVTFVPCFLWIFVGAPYLEWICAQPRLSSALAAITAAVVGVILNLSIWFGLHVLFGTVELNVYGLLNLWTPDIQSLDWRVVALTLISAVLLLKLHTSVVSVLFISALLGLAISYLV